MRPKAYAWPSNGKFYLSLLLNKRAVNEYSTIESLVAETDRRGLDVVWIYGPE